MIKILSKLFVPQTNFGSVQELWDASGKVITTLTTTPLREGAPADGPDAAPAGRGGAAAATDTGKRSIQWNPVGAGLVYLQSVFAAPGADSQPMDLKLPRCAIHKDQETGKQTPVIVVQAEDVKGNKTVGFRSLSGGNGVCLLFELELLDGPDDRFK